MNIYVWHEATIQQQQYIMFVCLTDVVDSCYICTSITHTHTSKHNKTPTHTRRYAITQIHIQTETLIQSPHTFTYTFISLQGVREEGGRRRKQLNKNNQGEDEREHNIRLDTRNDTHFGTRFSYRNTPIQFNRNIRLTEV